jgi:hypothetical protein
MGDEYTESHFFCNTCSAYANEVYRDRFLGERESFINGPLSHAEGDGQVEIIRACPESWSEKCRSRSPHVVFPGIPRLRNRVLQTFYPPLAEDVSLLDGLFPRKSLYAHNW